MRKIHSQQLLFKELMEVHKEKEKHLIDKQAKKTQTGNHGRRQNQRASGRWLALHTAVPHNAVGFVINKMGFNLYIYIHEKMQEMNCSGTKLY